MKNKKYLIFTIVAALLIMLPNISKASSNSSYTYRSTVIGTGIRDAGGHVYEINGQKSNFSNNESVYVLTRIFNINKIDRFQFKFQLVKRDGSLKSELYSPLYQPRGSWWAETYAWHNFGKLNRDNYDIKVYININNEGYRYVDHKQISVDGGYEYNDNYNYYDNYYDDNYYYEESDYESYYQPVNQKVKYEYNWTHAGTNVEGYGYYKFKIINKKTEFEKKENVYILTKLANIKGINEFKIKHELYLNGNDRSTVNESILFRPNRKNWEYNYTWHNFGKLPSGNHTVKVFIKINNESYKQIGSVAIKVGKESDNFKYTFNWTKTDTKINNLGDGVYDVSRDRNNFNTNENLKVLSKFSGIRGVDTFQVRHELKNSNGNLYKRLDSGVQKPEYRVWDKYFSQSDFGKIPAGDYRLETYVKFNDNSFQKVNSKNVSVKSGNCGALSYKFNWTKTATAINHLGDNIYDVNSDRTSFYTDENVKALSRISHINNADTFQVRHELKNYCGGLYKRLDSGVQKPNYGTWDYYFAQNDFGKIPAGDYILETYVKFNSGDFVKVDNRNVDVRYKNGDLNRESYRSYNCDNSNENNYDDDYDDDEVSYDNRYYDDDYYNRRRRGLYSGDRDGGYSWTRDERTYQQPTRTAYNYY